MWLVMNFMMLCRIFLYENNAVMITYLNSVKKRVVRGSLGN